MTLSLLAVVVVLTGNLAVVWLRPAGAPPRWVELLWLIGVLPAAVAAHLPGMEVLGKRERVREHTVTRAG